MKVLIIYPLGTDQHDDIDGLVSTWLISRIIRRDMKIFLNQIEIKFFDPSKKNLMGIEDDSWFDPQIDNVYIVDCLLPEKDYHRWKEQKTLIYIFCKENNLGLRSQIPKIEKLLVSSLVAERLSLAAAITEKALPEEPPSNIVHALNEYYIKDEDPKWEDIYYGVKAHFSQLYPFKQMRPKMACFWLDLIREKNVAELIDLLQHLGSAFKSYSCSVTANQPTKTSQ